MRNILALMVISSLVLSGCSGWRDSRANPVNWFGKSRSAPVQQTNTAQDVNPLIPQQRDTIFSRARKAPVYEGTPVDQVGAMHIERTAGGAIIRATAITLQQGAHDLRLVPENEEEPVEGVLTYTLKAVQPTDQPQGPQRTRTFEVARFVSDQNIQGVRSIRVVAARNSQTSRR